MEITREMLDSIIEFNPGDFAIYQMNSGRLRTIYYSPELFRHPGMEHDEYDRIIRDDASAIIIDSDKKHVAEAIMMLMKEREKAGIVNITYRIKHKTRGAVWINARAKVVGTIDGMPVAVVSFQSVGGVGEHSVLLGHTSAIIYVVDKENYELLYANDYAFKTWGKTDIVGKKCYEFVNGMDSPCEWCSIPEMENGACHKEACFAPLQNIWFDIDCWEMDWYGRAAVAVYAVDVTDELNLELDKKSLDTTISNIPIGVGVCAVRNGKVVSSMVNQQLKDMLDMTADDFISSNRGIAEKLHPDDVTRVMSSIVGVRDEASTAAFDFRYNRGDGYRWFHTQANTLSSKDGRTVFVCISEITQEKKAQEELLNVHRIYESALEEAKLLAWEYDVKTHRVTIAESVAHKKNYDKAGISSVIENAPETLVRFIEDDYKEAFLEMYRQIDNGVPKASCEIWYRLQEKGELKCQHITCVTIFDEAGEPVSAYGIGQIITDQKLAEKKYEQAYKQLEEAHPLSIASFRLNLTENWCGDGRSKLDFVPKQQDAGTADGYFSEFAKIIADEDLRKKALEMFDRKQLLEAFSRGETMREMEYPVEYSDGSRHWRNGMLFMLQNPNTGDIEGVTYAIDIDDRKRNDLILSHLTGDRYDQIGLIHIWNNTYEFLSKREVDQYQAGNIIDYERSCDYVRTNMIAPEDLEHFNRCVNLNVIINNLNSDGNYSTSYRRIIDEKVSYVHIQYCWMEKTDGDILVFQTDITDTVNHEQEQIRKIKDALFEADKANEAKSAFLSSMSHDLRTPLNGVLAFTSFALRENDSAKKQEYLEKIQLSGRLLMDLVDDTLELSRIESGKMVLEAEATDTASIGMEVITALRPSAGLKRINLIAVAADFPTEIIWVDKLKLQKIFLNLLSNAIKYTPEGGTIRCRVEIIDPPADGRNRRIIIEDNGIGMSEEFMTRMYEPFSQEKRHEANSISGTGLGLSIVKRYVDMLNGTIDVESRINEGTKFTVEIPVRKLSDVEITGSRERISDSALKGRRILLCEDNYMNREIAEIMLKDKGITMDHVENGKAGVEIFAGSAEYYYDAVLMDISMPVMDGLEATRLIRGLDRADARTVPIIAMTADAFEESAREALKSGMTEYITKPIDPDKLMDVLWRQIGK